jgi:hypothetical protein
MLHAMSAMRRQSDDADPIHTQDSRSSWIGMELGVVDY